MDYLKKRFVYTPYLARVCISYFNSGVANSYAFVYNLIKFVQNYERVEIESIAFPKLGCGNGGLDWTFVKPIMEYYLKPLPINVFIYVDNYIDSTSELTDYFVDWVHSNPKNLNFLDLKEEIRDDNNVLYSDDKIKYVDWFGDRLIINNGMEVTVTDREFCDFRDYISD